MEKKKDTRQMDFFVMAKCFCLIVPVKNTGNNGHANGRSQQGPLPYFAS